jgi:hypothetical protein
MKDSGSPNLLLNLLLIPVKQYLWIYFTKNEVNYFTSFIFSVRTAFPFCSFTK